MYRRDDRVHPLTRLATLAVCGVLLGGVVLLLGWPTHTNSLWAWTIQPPMTALAIGAGFASGVYFFGRAVFARQWHTIGPGLGPVWLFTLITAASTALHWDRFNHANVTFWVWPRWCRWC